MGIFQEMCEFVNRTSKPLEIIYDGQRTTLPPNYDEQGNKLEDVHTMLPVIVIPYALNQNVLMGSEDAVDPSDFVSKVGIVKQAGKKGRSHSWHDCSFLVENPDELTRVRLADVLEDPNAKIQIRGKAIPRAVDAGLPGMTTPFDPR